ncbi:MAG: dihydropteroate synthase, partial [Planctomycetaceae bacterium]|nr:dihydropteroate synthase [Planctomycetaceae bacterium]
MGILNVTPDSFSDGGQFGDIGAAVEHARQLVADGADLIDVGGESTRPGAPPVPVAEELRRVIPVVARLAGELSTPISIDTMKGQVAREAVAAGASIVNDVSAGLFDPDLLNVCAGTDCGLILMHMQGSPQTMQANPQYDDVLGEVRDFLRKRMAACESLGIARERIVLDPGIGFGKTADHNIELLSHVAELRNEGRPVLMGHSRKRFLYKLLGRETDERLAGTIGVSIALWLQGADILRVHDVAAVRDAL